MDYKLISGDNHLDLTYCPRDLWSSRAPAKWKPLVPQVIELDDGLHWFIEGRDVGMWNGIGPVFYKYQRGQNAHLDSMTGFGFDWDNSPNGMARPSDPRARLADLDRDGIDAEIVYGCLLLDDFIPDLERRAWSMRVFNDWVIDFARRTDPRRVFPLAMIPNTDPEAAAAEIRRCAAMGLKGGDLPFKGMPVPMYHDHWDPVWEAAAECRFPLSFHSTGFRGLKLPKSDTEFPHRHLMVASTLFQLDGTEILASIIMSGACERHPGFRFVLAEAGVTWLPYILDRMDVIFEDRGRGKLNFSRRPSEYFHRQGYATYQQDGYLEPVLPVIGEDNIIWGSDYPHPDCVWPESKKTLERNLAAFPERVQRKITCENAKKLYAL